MLSTAIALAATTSGCALFLGNGARTSLTANRQILPPIPAPKDTVEIEVFFIERPVNDTLTGPPLWRALNQAGGALSDRARLASEGIQCGISPSSAPFALQALLDPARSRGTASQTLRHQYAIPAGESTTIKAAYVPEPLVIPSANKSRPDPIAVPDADCSFQMSAERIQDGWVRLSFQPEIYYGTEQIRPKATPQEFILQRTKNVEQYFDQRFSIEVNTGEYVVIGYAGETPSSLGGLFFRNGDPHAKVGRLMVVRVVGMQQVTAVRAEGRSNAKF